MMNYKRNHKFIGLSFALALMSSLNCQAQLLPTPTQEAKPGVRWWWMGSAVDKENLKWNLDEYAKAGIGARFATQALTGRARHARTGRA